MVLLLNHIKNWEFVQIIPERLIAVITRNDFTKIIVEVLDQVLV